MGLRHWAGLTSIYMQWHSSAGRYPEYRAGPKGDENNWEESLYPKALQHELKRFYTTKAKVFCLFYWRSFKSAEGPGGQVAEHHSPSIELNLPPTLHVCPCLFESWVLSRSASLSSQEIFVKHICTTEFFFPIHGVNKIFHNNIAFTK